MLRVRRCQRHVKSDPLSAGEFESLSQHSSAMRRAMGRRGRKRQLVVEDEYWALVMDGVGTVEACRRVGIGRKTGYRWRAERGGLPPLRLPEAERGDRYLSLIERKRIATLRERGHGVREIARRVGGRRRRSAGSCAATLPHTTTTATTLTSRRLELAPDGCGRAADASSTTSSCAQSSRAASSWSGARSRSPPGCATPTRIGRTDMSATRRSIRPSTTAAHAG
jgi:hypothetical protein